MSSATLYRRHEPEHTALYGIVERHLPALVAQLEDQGASLPSFVHREFDAYLRCGRLEHGFIRVKCDGCRHEHLVAFSCKRRGFCPSCGARRMADTAAHLVDNVIPAAPVRQWVLSFPWPLRLLFASRPATLSSCLAIVVRAIETHLIRRAGLARSSGARTGAITLIQRFGSALNLNVHLHILVLDGVYTSTNDAACFHPVRPPQADELQRLLDRIIQRILRRLTAQSLLVADPEHPWLNIEAQDALDSLSGASIRYRVAIGPGAGARTLTLKNRALRRERPAGKPFTVDRDGFSLNAAVACQPQQRNRLERLCRYVTRPAICLDRLSTDAAGKVVLELKRPFRDGTTHLLFGPEDFVARLAALVPRPRSNLTRYHGVFAPNSRLRKLVVPAAIDNPRSDQKRKSHPSNARCTMPRRRSGVEPSIQGHLDDELRAPLSWAQRLKRVFLIDVIQCPHCGGKLRHIADVTNPALIAKILAHRQVRAPPPPAGPRQPHPAQQALFSAS